jgi:hypothetical protein
MICPPANEARLRAARAPHRDEQHLHAIGEHIRRESDHGEYDVQVPSRMLSGHVQHTLETLGYRLHVGPDVAVICWEPVT